MRIFRWEMARLDSLVFERWPVRFNDLARQLGEASKKMVSQRLRELEEANLVERKVLCDRPIALNYEITGFGRTALGIFKDLKNWVESNQL